MQQSTLRQWRRWRLYAVLGAWAVAGLYWGLDRWLEHRQQQRYADRHVANLESLTSQPQPFDYYVFQSAEPPLPGKPYPEYDHPIGKVFRAEPERVGFLLAWSDLLKGNDDETFLQQLFRDSTRQFDTLWLTRNALVQAAHKDSVSAQVGRRRFTILELLEIKRLNGPLCWVFTRGKDRIGLRNSTLLGTITAVEPIHGQVSNEEPLPLVFEPQGGRTLYFKVVYDGGKVEFRIKGHSPLAGQWTNRVVIDGDESWVVQE